jgi:hypothetical protein
MGIFAPPPCKEHMLPSWTSLLHGPTSCVTSGKHPDLSKPNIPLWGMSTKPGSHGSSEYEWDKGRASPALGEAWKEEALPVLVSTNAGLLPLSHCPWLHPLSCSPVFPKCASYPTSSLHELLHWLSHPSLVSSVPIVVQPSHKWLQMTSCIDPSEL